MPVIDVVLVMRDSVEVSEAQVQPVRERIQAGLDEAVGVLFDHGATFEGDQEWRAVVREEEAAGG